MKKLIILLVLAAAVVGAIIGLMSIKGSGNTSTGPKFESAEAKEWQSKIDSLCTEDNWSEKGYNSISTGIRTDWKTSNGELISKDEETALQGYLFSKSCDHLNKQVDILFKKSSYPANELKSAEDALSFLNSKLGEFKSNSNLTQASNILSEYYTLLGCISFSGNAMYSSPLKAFRAVSVDDAKSRIKGLKYYASHFSKNTSIKSQVDNLASNRARAEGEYYMNLEKCVEKHYKETNDLPALLQDQVEFYEISTNSNATEKLEYFVKNPNR